MSRPQAEQRPPGAPSRRRPLPFLGSRLLTLSCAVALCACTPKDDDIALPGPPVAATEGAARTPAKKAADEKVAAARKEKDPRHLLRNIGEPEYLDPGLTTESEGGKVIHDTFEGLYTYGADHTTWPNGVAESHTISEDGRTYTFKLRTNAKWSDGKPVTAHDFEFAWKRVLDPKTASRYAAIMWIIDGARAFSEGKGERDDVKISAKDDHTFEVTLQAPTPYFLQLTAFYTYQPVPRHVVEKHGDQWARAGTMVSNGPWVVTEWKARQQIVAVQNVHYWDKGAVPFDKITWRIAQENGPAHNLYVSNELDLLEKRVPETHLPTYLKTSNPELRVSPYLGVYFYVINVKARPFDDVRVRQALNLAIDKSKVGTNIVKGQQEQAWDVVHPGLEAMGYEPALGAYDPNRARELLAEAGYPGGKGFPEFQLTYNTIETHKAIAEFVQQQWKANLGIPCSLENIEWKVMLKKLHAKDYAVSRYGWIGDFADPMTFLDLWEGGNPNNHASWVNAEYDALLTAARRSADPKVRMAKLNAAAKIVNTEVPAIPIYFYVQHDMAKPWLKGYKPHIQGVHPSRWLSVEL